MPDVHVYEWNEAKTRIRRVSSPTSTLKFGRSNHILLFFFFRITETPVKPKDAFPILKEIKYKFKAWKRTLGHIADAFFYLVYDVPMLRRIHIN